MVRLLARDRDATVSARLSGADAVGEVGARRRRAQWLQQKVSSSTSTPCPSTVQPQWAHRGAIAWTAHSNESNTPAAPSDLVMVKVRA
ncbi:hypothetical protein GCM10007368_12560 [Isoptericola cucumis]|uniref:Uncharacterized protein n=1 Tax=Isoptericola cucumis TaxID=1776856 RepID=A0ABQ2B379_9MICO|nr:hypothetical protein GCM10007368_12560 [Isoptericola cucumis]